jgi:hypothetical protein
MSPEPPSEFIRGPKWRTRALPATRHRAAAATFAVIVAVGVATMYGAVRLSSWAGAPGWVVAMPWWLPTVGVLGWTLLRPTTSGLSDDDDDSWFGYSIRWVLVGELEPRPAPQRLIAAVLFGAPVVWSVLVLGLLTIVGLV